MEYPLGRANLSVGVERALFLVSVIEPPATTMGPTAAYMWLEFASTPTAYSGMGHAALGLVCRPDVRRLSWQPNFAHAGIQLVTFSLESCTPATDHSLTVVDYQSVYTVLACTQVKNLHGEQRAADCNSVMRQNSERLRRRGAAELTLHMHLAIRFFSSEIRLDYFSPTSPLSLSHMYISLIWVVLICLVLFSSAPAIVFSSP